MPHDGSGIRAFEVFRFGFGVAGRRRNSRVKHWGAIGRNEAPPEKEHGITTPQHAKDRHRQNGPARTTAGGGKQLGPNQRELRQMGRSPWAAGPSIRRHWDWLGRAAVASGRWEHYRRAVRPQPLPDGTGENKSGARHLG
jgi:hypothetical protein